MTGRMPRTDEVNMHRAPCPLDAAGSRCSGSLAQLMKSAIAINWHVAAAQT
jgi:hypothetical protein